MLNFLKMLFENRNQAVYLVCLLFFTFIIGYLLSLIIHLVKQHTLVKESRKDAVNRSRAVLTGQIGEQMAPFLPNFPCEHDAVRFIGKPIDFIGFATNENNNIPFEEKTIKEILFIEVKSGNSTLTKREKEIKKAVEEGRVRYIEYRIG